MIITNIIGGLGNQMFQYAAGKALACKHGTVLKLDTRDFNRYQLHPLELRRLFPEICSEATPASIRKICGYKTQPTFKRALRKIGFRRLNNQLIFEPKYTFWPDFLQLPDNIYLDGYWQSERYFIDHEKTIRNDFRFPVLSDPINLGLADEISRVASVSLHVRRGDYVTHSINQTIYYQCTMDYYHHAIKHINDCVENPEFFVFSDDIEWAQRTFANYDIRAFVGHNNGARNYIDMQLMSLCKYNIIANSTFSWWAAWLNQNPGKIVISPQEWFVNGQSSHDLIPPNWIKI